MNQRRKLTAIVLLIVAMLVAASANAQEAPAPAPETNPAYTPKTCGGFVSPQVYNRLLRKQKALTGSRPKARSKPVTRCAYNARKRVVKKARADCLRKAQRTEASVYWPGADSGGMIGSCGHHLSQFTYAYAELGMGTYLGGLRCGTTLYMHGPNGKTVAGPKVDIGYGSGSSRRGIDLWNRTGPAIGIGNGIGRVTVSRRNCWV